MPSATDLHLDDLVLSLASHRWQKVAMIIAKALRECQERAIQVNDDALAMRIKTLVQNGRLESEGDLSEWRSSEVRLPAPSTKSGE